jgi:hypothetical protein
MHDLDFSIFESFLRGCESPERENQLLRTARHRSWPIHSDARAARRYLLDSAALGFAFFRRPEVISEVEERARQGLQ